MTKPKNQKPKPKPKSNPKAKQILEKKEIKTKKHDGYVQRQTTVTTKRGTKNIINEYTAQGNFNFDAIKSIQNFYDKLNSEYADNIFYVKVLTNAGWYTAATNNGMIFKDSENYFSGKVKDETKFTDNVSKIVAVIKNV